MDVHPYAWIITIVVIIIILGIDVVWMARRPHEPTMTEAGIGIGFFVLLALLFGAGVSVMSGVHYGGQFFAGWITEYSLSVDNLFIFVIVMAKLKVPRPYQQYALLVGILLALVLRGIFIALGAGLINLFEWVFFVFGAFLIYTAIRLIADRHTEREQQDPDNAVMRLARKVLPATDDFCGTRLTVRREGRRMVTPMLFVIIALGSIDLVFALDSIPAIYGLTREPYLVFTANLFALMGLRQLYFLLGGLLQRLVYLPVGLSIVLAFIGVKLILSALDAYDLPRRIGLDLSLDIPTWVSLAVIVVTLAVTTVASLIKSGRDARPSGEQAA